MPTTLDVSDRSPSGSPTWSEERPCLILVAAPREYEAVSSVFAGHASFEVVQTGVGPVNAALATLWAYEPLRHAAAISFGVAGAHPARGPALHDTVLASESQYGDLGVRTPEGLTSLPDMGFPVLPWADCEDEMGGAGGACVSLHASSALRAVLETLADASMPIATVSACSGTIEAADELAGRGCVVEAMEGAGVAHAVAYALHKAGVEVNPAALPFAELRVISNTTGPRNEQVWDLNGALVRLTQLADALARI